MLFPCPHCHSNNTRSFRSIYESGSYTTSTHIQGYHGGYSSRSHAETQLANRCRPPFPQSRLTGLLIGGCISFFLWSHFEGRATWQTLALSGLWLIAAVPLFWRGTIPVKIFSIIANFLAVSFWYAHLFGEKEKYPLSASGIAAIILQIQVLAAGALGALMVDNLNKTKYLPRLVLWNRSWYCLACGGSYVVH